ncbi:MAG: biotin transporter BioY [Elusimicrobia bacterium]|nr:biotin transporter BioY [Elusimicrobiota bacterium]
MSTAVLNRSITNDAKVVKAIGVSFFVLATTFGAYVRIPLPFTPVPITLQTFFVLLSGLVMGKKLGGVSQISYLLLGGLGLPLFTNTGALLGPTGGYIIGFIVASWLTGFLLEKNWKIFYILLLSDFVLLFCGAVNLAFFVGSFKRAIILGMLPFVVGDIVKIFAAISVFNIYKNFRR